jgi:hypothetical protein
MEKRYTGNWVITKIDNDNREEEFRERLLIEALSAISQTKNSKRLQKYVKRLITK